VGDRSPAGGAVQFEHSSRHHFPYQRARAHLQKDHAYVLDIYIDADGCPVKEEVYRVASRYQLKVYVVANKRIQIPMGRPMEMVVVPRGLDVADDWITSHIEKDDIAITGDIPLADRCLKKGARVLGIKGTEFREDNIGSAIAARELMSHLREIGQLTSGPAAMAPKDRSRFLSKLDEIIQSIQRHARVSED
jgi:hypothetical protein